MQCSDTPSSASSPAAADLNVGTRCPFPVPHNKLSFGQAVWYMYTYYKSHVVCIRLQVSADRQTQWLIALAMVSL